MKGMKAEEELIPKHGGHVAWNSSDEKGEMAHLPWLRIL